MVGLKRALTILMTVVVAISAADSALAIRTSDRITALEEYHGYYPCMDCHADQETDPTPRFLIEEHEIPMEWEDDEGISHAVEFGELLAFSDLYQERENADLRQNNLLRIGERLNAREFMEDNDYAPNDSIWVLTHGGANLWCLDCHSSADYNLLHKLTGGTLTFNETHLLCGQCHGPILRDWEAGIHGKTVGYWNQEMDTEDETIRMLCVECHIAHAPRFRRLTPEVGPVTRIDNISNPGHQPPRGEPDKVRRDELGPHPWLIDKDPVKKKTDSEEAHH